MPQIITQTDIELPPDLIGITEENFWAYLSWQEDKRELTRRFIKKFESTLFSRTPFSNENRPKQETETPLSTDQGLEFLVITKPTSKRPSYNAVYEEFKNFLSFLLDQHTKGILRRGVRTFDQFPYVSTPELIEKIEEEEEKQTTGKEGINQSLKPLAPETLLQELPQRVSLVFGRDYSAFTDYNSRLYIGTTNFTAEGDKRTKPFKALLLEDSLQTLGAKPEDLAAVAYPFETHTFIHQLEPRETPRYSAILDALKKPAPKSLTKKSKIGDLVLATMIIKGNESRLREKGLIDDGFIADYSPLSREGLCYVRLNGVIKRLQTYRETLVTPGIEQNISLRPTRKP